MSYSIPLRPTYYQTGSFNKEKGEIEITDYPTPPNKGFNGGDYTVYIDEKDVDSLVDIGWSTNPLLDSVTGESIVCIEGHLTLQQHDREPLLYGVFKNQYNVLFAEQLPSFNLTITAVKNGLASTTALLDVNITGTYRSFSSTELVNYISYTFTAKSVIPWHPLIPEGTILQ